MAMFHLSTNPISRKSGRTATASSAYRAGAKMTDDRTGITHDYTKKKGVVSSDCFVYVGDEKVQINREHLWNTAEKKEKRKDSRTAREIIVNIPHELNDEQRKYLIDDFTKTLSQDLECAIDYAIHKPNRKGDQRNHHAHIMLTTRKATLENNKIVLGDKTNLELENKKLKSLNLPSTQQQITDIRKKWADITNAHLKKAGINEVIDHRSFKEIGLDREPTVKMGVSATALERQGVRTKKGDINRQVRAMNKEKAKLEFMLSEQSNTENEPKLSFLEKRRLQNVETQEPPKPVITETKQTPNEPNEPKLSFLEKRRLQKEQALAEQKEQERLQQEQALAEQQRQQQANSQPRTQTPKPF